MKKYSLIFFIIFIITGFISSVDCYAENILILNENSLSGKLIGNYVEYIQDSNSSLTIDRILKSKNILQFKHSNKETQNFDYNTDPIWLIFTAQILWIDQNVKSIKDDKGRIVEFDSIARDIPDWKIAEEFSSELIKELETFRGQNTFNDDLTMVVLDVL